MRLRVMDLFCGTGGFSKGFEDEGHFEVVFGIDLLRASIETFRLNHQSALAIAGDIRNVTPIHVAEWLEMRHGEIDVIVGGPPCQGFSSIRPYRSSKMEDRRNSLFLDFANYIMHFRPKIFVLENVVGLATHNGGRTISAIQQTFEQLGYTVDWRILNAAHYGLPQKRERLIMIGSEPRIALSFPQPTHFCGANTIGIQDKKRKLLPAERDLFSLDIPPLPNAVTVAEAIDDLPSIESGEQATEYTSQPRTEYQRARRMRSASLTMHSSTSHSPKMLEIIRHSGSNISYIPKHLITSGFSSSYSRLALDEPSVTITVNFVHPASNRCIHPTQNRALTPREGARLQGFDDDFVFAGSRTEIVKQIGNAVPPLLGKVIASHIARLLGAPPVSPSPLHAFP